MAGTPLNALATESSEDVNADGRLLRSNCPSPPPTECSEEVILPVTEGKVTASSNGPTIVSINDVLPATMATSGAIKSEPCTPHAERSHDVLTKDRERCSLEVEILG